MEERIDIWDEHGRPTGRTALKSEAHQNGWYHPTVHIWFYSPRGEILLQKRGDDKDTYPGLWDVSVAGHIGAGESTHSAALREIQEEIGLEVPLELLQSVFVDKASHRHPNGILDNEFRHVYLCPLQTTVSKLIPQQSEVSELKLLPLLQFAEETWGLARPGVYVPHGADYYGRVVREVRLRL
ncbi:NUDIX hydrolase [Robiginitalea sediminis]|uniref:NUDIX hydrolase n=1 Tax=Robiginitalea sediminis TaxID=1982593 RepID=UPI000B4ACC20|nr:NUDIX domain-containing protein [Robiginitalea sediminis]